MVVYALTGILLAYFETKLEQLSKYSGFPLLNLMFMTLYRLLRWKLKTQNHFLYKPL